MRVRPLCFYSYIRPMETGMYWKVTYLWASENEEEHVWIHATSIAGSDVVGIQILDHRPRYKSWKETNTVFTGDLSKLIRCSIPMIALDWLIENGGSFTQEIYLLSNTGWTVTTSFLCMKEERQSIDREEYDSMYLWFSPTGFAPDWDWVPF